jgi:hypothetical protein
MVIPIVLLMVIFSSISIEGLAPLLKGRTIIYVFSKRLHDRTDVQYIEIFIDLYHWAIHFNILK